MNADTGSQTSFIEQSIRYFHNVRVHPVLTFEERYVVHVALQPLEHRSAEFANTNDGWKLAVVPDKDKAARAKNESEGERLG